MLRKNLNEVSMVEIESRDKKQLVPVLKDRPSWMASVVGGVAMLAGGGLPHNLGLLVGVAAGVAAGLAADRGRFRAGDES